MEIKWKLLHTTSKDGLRWFSGLPGLTGQSWRGQGADEYDRCIQRVAKLLNKSDSETMGLPFVADWSGRTPDKTDSGPHLLDPRRTCHVSASEIGSISVWIPVLHLREPEDHMCTVGEIGDLVWLLASGHVKTFTLSDDLKTLAKLIMLQEANDAAKQREEELRRACA